uniref:Uncharacterized protein n=1 Tax=Arundo donax TaxID=35708 RepID=A0A0A8ZUP0_ARUDO
MNNIATQHHNASNGQELKDSRTIVGEQKTTEGFQCSHGAASFSHAQPSPMPRG